MKRSLAFTAAFALLYGPSALADPTLKVSTGSESGNYHAAFQNIVDICKLPLEEATSKGSNENIERAARNQTHAFFAQTDALFMYDGTVKKLDNIKTIIALYPEELHFIAPLESKFSKKGMTSFGKKQFNSVADLGGYPVGVIGGSGSATTGEFVAGKLGSGGQPFFELRTYPGEDALKNAVANGEVAAALLVGGQPLGSVEKYGPSFKILPVDDGIISRLSKYYDSSKLSYSKMNARGTVTLATSSGIFGRQLNDKEKVATYAAIRQCVTDKIGTFQDDGIPKWADVKPEDHGRWSWYDLPSAAPSAAPEVKAKKRK